MGFKRLRDLAPRRPGRDRPPADKSAVQAGAVALEDDTWGPSPVLRPAAIFYRTLIDATELTPVWARPRATSASPSSPTVEEPATRSDQPPPPKRPRRPKAKASSDAAPTRSKKAAKRDRRATAD